MDDGGFAQLEKVLVRACFDARFTQDLLDQGETAAERYGFDAREGRVLALLLQDDGEGLFALFNVVRAVLETRMLLGATWQAPVAGSGAEDQQAMGQIARHAG